MSSTSRVGAAVAAGYFLGRFKKLRLALIVGSALANKNVRSRGLGFLQQGTQSLGSSPEVKKLSDQVTSQLVDAGKAAAVTAAASRIDQLSDSLNERSSQLREVADVSGEGSPAEGSEDEAAVDEGPDEDAPEEPEAREQEPEDEASEAEGSADEAAEDEEPDEAPEDEASEPVEDEEEPRSRSKPTRRRRRSASPAGSGRS